MGSYILNFTVYTMAMCGLIFFALFVYKKFADGGMYSKNSKFLNVEDTLSLGPRKTLYVIRAGKEKFLVAGDADKTSLISKLAENTDETSEFASQLKQVQIQPQKITNYTIQTEPKNIQRQEISKETTNFTGIDDLPQIVDFPQKNRGQKSGNVIKSMIAKVKE